MSSLTKLLKEHATYFMHDSLRVKDAFTAGRKQFTHRDASTFGLIIIR